MPGIPGSGLGGSRPTGGNGGDAGKLGVVPNLYASLQLNEKWFIGLGIGAPFGLMTKYDEGWAGQYHSNKFDIKTINVNPSVAYKVNDKFSMGFGLNWQRIDAEYKEDRGAIARAGPPGLHQWRCRPQFEGRRLGLERGLHAATHRGHPHRPVVPLEDPPDGQGRYRHRQHRADPPVRLVRRQGDRGPADTLILSAAHQLNERWELLGDISWTGWSSIPALKIRNSGTGAKDDELPLNFRDTWRLAVGANYKFAPDWKWKFGLAYDQSPVHKEQDRPTSLPDNDRYWFSTGVQWQATKNTTLDVGYTYLYLRKTYIDTNSGNALAKGRVAGSYDSSGHIFGLQVSSRF